MLPKTSLYLMDSTGLSYGRKDQALRYRRGEEVRRVRGHSRLLALVRWERGRKLLWPWGGSVDPAYAPDPPLGGRPWRCSVPGEVYRLRGVVEGVFGAIKTRWRGGYGRERMPRTAMLRALLELVAYGLRVLPSLLPPPPGYKAIY